MEPTVRPSPGGSRLVLTGRPPLAALRMPAAYPGQRHPAFELLHLQKAAARGLHRKQNSRHYYSTSSLSSDVTTGSEDVSMDDDDDASWDETFQGTSFPLPASPVTSRRSLQSGRSHTGHPTSLWDSENVTTADYDIIFNRPTVTSTPCRRRHPAGRQSHHQPARAQQPARTHHLAASSFSSLRALQGSDVSTMTSPPSPQQQEQHFRYVQQRLPGGAHQQRPGPRHSSTPIGHRHRAGPRRGLYTSRKSSHYVSDDSDAMTSSTVESGYSSHGDPLSGSDPALHQAHRHYVTSCDSSDVTTSDSEFMTDSEAHSGMMTYQSGMMTSHSGIRYQSLMTSQSSMMTSQSDMMTYRSGMMTSHSAMTYNSGMMESDQYPCSSDDSELTLGNETLESLSQAEQEAYADDLETYFRSSVAPPSGRNKSNNRTGRSVALAEDVDTTVFSTASDATDFMKKPTNRKLPVTVRAPQPDRRKVIARCLKKMGQRLKLSASGKHGSTLHTLAIV